MSSKGFCRSILNNFNLVKDYTARPLSGLHVTITPQVKVNNVEDILCIMCHVVYVKERILHAE